MRLALRMSPSIIPNISSAMFDECDPELARNAMPANLTLLEGILRNDPSNKKILKTLSMGFCGYSMLFVEPENPAHASELYLRARNYGIKCMGEKSVLFEDYHSKHFYKILNSFGEKDFEALFWVTLSWCSWINLNLDNPVALAQLENAEACLKKILELNAFYLNGLPCILMGSFLSARPEMFGGDLEQAKTYFEKALQFSSRKYFPAQYYYARYYCVGTQDRALFSDLLNEIINGDPVEIEGACLMNAVMRKNAINLLSRSDEYFF